AAGLEMTVTGPEVEFLVATQVTIGGDVDCSPSGRRPRMVRAGDRLRFRPVRKGVRAYLAIAGGLAPPRAHVTTRRLQAGEGLSRAEAGTAHPPIPPLCD